MPTDKNGKITYEMKSPGDAWNDHVNNDMGAAKVTPAWADNPPNNAAIQQQVADLNKKVDALQDKQGQDVNQPDQDKGNGVGQFDKWRQEYREKQNNPDKEKDKVKEKNKDKEPNVSR